MTTPGYPDYTRLSLQTGILLFGGNQPFPAQQVVFQGYLGNIEYINFFWNAVGGTDNYLISIQFSPDSTFSSLIAQVISVRGGNSEGYRQYGLLSPWVTIQVTPHTGGSNTSVQMACYGCMGEISSAKLGGFDDPILAFSGSVAASTIVTQNITAIAPGRATLSIFTTATTWDIELQKWNLGAANFSTFWQVNSTKGQVQGSFNVSLPDNIMQVRIDNADAGAQSFAVYLMPTM